MLGLYSTVASSCDGYYYIWNSDNLSMTKITHAQVVNLITQKGVQIQGVNYVNGALGMFMWYPSMFESNGYRFAWQGKFHLMIQCDLKVCNLVMQDFKLYMNDQLINDCCEIMCPVLRGGDLYVYYTKDNYELNRVKCKFI